MPVYRGSLKCHVYKGSDLLKGYKGSQLVMTNRKIGFHASVVGLGNQNPSSVTFTRDTGFPTTFEEITIGTDIFIKFPTMYRKIDKVVSGQITDFTISTEQDDATYHPYPCFLNPATQEILPYVLIGKYCNSSSGIANSVNANPITKNMADSRTSCSNKGTGYQQFDWQFQKLFVDLALVISQKVNFNDGTVVIDSYLGVSHLKHTLWIDGVSKPANNTWVAAKNPSNYRDQPTDSSGYQLLSYGSPTASEKLIQKLGYDSNLEFLNYPNIATLPTSANYYCDTFFWNRTGSRPVSSNIGDATWYSGLFGCGTSASWTSLYAFRLCYRPLN